MNKDVLLSLAKLRGIESAEIISSSIFSAISENAQETYSEQMDQTTDFGYSNFSGLYEDLLQNEYTEEQIGAKIEGVAEPMIDAYSKKYADIRQISYSTETYDEIREQVSQIVYAQIEEDLNTIGEASEMSMAEFAEQLQEENPDDDNLEETPVNPEEEIYASFEELDTNGDGVVSREEWEAAGLCPEEFDKIDANSDGVIERKEFEDYYL